MNNDSDQARLNLPNAYNLLGLLVNACEPNKAIETIISAVQKRVHFSVACLASYSFVATFDDDEHAIRINNLSLRVCDGQPVRWAINHFYSTRLNQRVYGPDLMRELLKRAEIEHWPVYFYGSNPPVLSDLRKQLREIYPSLKIAGMQAGSYKQVDQEEQVKQAKIINDSGARIVFVGLGTPRQDIWLYEHRDILPICCVAVGAGFDYLAGHLPKPPSWMANNGLQWLHRFLLEPRRLARRSIVSNGRFLWAIIKQILFGPRKPLLDGTVTYRGES